MKEAKDQYLSDGGATDPYLLQRLDRSLVECADANGNSPLSEAAAGGSVPAVAILVELGAEVNSIGQFGRSPLYRSVDIIT